jgi:hypothetical protein
LPRLEEVAATQARVAKALRLVRFPRATGDILTFMADSGLSAHLTLIDDFAVYGYETMLMHDIPLALPPAQNSCCRMI